MENKNTETIASLRAAADWLEQYPELPKVYCGNIAVFYKSDDQKADVAVVAKAMGAAEKVYTESIFLLKKMFGREANISYVADREQVCEQVLVGKRIEPAHTIPATEERFVPEHEVPVYEWRCAPLLAASEPEAA